MFGAPLKDALIKIAAMACLLPLHQHLYHNQHSPQGYPLPQ